MIFINPSTSKGLIRKKNYLTDNKNLKVEIKNNCIFLFENNKHYSDNFGFQWNKFNKTQIDDDSNKLSLNRLEKQTNWKLKEIVGQNILEVGSGAGRFTRCLLQNCNSNIYSVDSSEAIFANYKNNKNYINNSNLFLVKSSVYSMPFNNNTFDKVICLGVLQHTPDVKQTIKCLIDKTKIGGEIILDFYPLKGWWTKIHAKYILRPILSKLSNKNLLKLIRFYSPFFYYISLVFNKIGLHFLTRFFPICDLRTLPKNITNTKEWVILDTFDMFSPKYDQPQKLSHIKKIFRNYGTKVDFCGYIKVNQLQSAIIRATKIQC